MNKRIKEHKHDLYIKFLKTFLGKFILWIDVNNVHKINGNWTDNLKVKPTDKNLRRNVTINNFLQNPLIQFWNTWDENDVLNRITEEPVSYTVQYN